MEEIISSLEPTNVDAPNGGASREEAATMKPIALEASADAIIAAEMAVESEEQRQLMERVAALREECRVSVEMPYPEEQCLLQIDGVPFFAKGDIHAIKAKQKMGKTHVIAIMCAALLCQKWYRMESVVPDARILLFDTEQKPADTQTIYRKILAMSGLPEKDIFDRLQVFTLRRKTAEERLRAVKDLTMAERPDIVFLDGVVDLSADFNDVADSQSLINELLLLSTDADCAIVNVLHTNKAIEDNNMRGHLGTMMAQKSGNVFECHKDKGIITVSSSDSRHSPVPDWSFTFGENGEVECADERVRLEALHKAAEKATKKAVEKRQTLDAHHEICKAIFASSVGFLPQAKLKKLYAEKAQVCLSSARIHIGELVREHRLIDEDGTIRLASKEEIIGVTK